MSTVVIMPGGFHPFHAGHMALYNSARKAFPDAELFVAATDSREERPFPFAIKEKLAKVAGVEPGHFIQVKSPFQAKEITQNYNPEQDVLIFVRSEKDRNESPKPGGMKKDGTPAYFQPYDAENLQPFGKHAYFAYLPTVKFGPGITSATEIRKAWPTLDDRRKTAMVMSLYPATQKNLKLAQVVVKLLDAGMGGQQGVAEGSDGWIGNPAKWKEAVHQAHGPDVVFKNYSHPGQPGKRSVNAINAAGKQVGVYQRHNKMGMVQPNEQGVAEGDENQYLPPNPVEVARIRHQTLKKLNPVGSQFIWKKPNQIGGSFSEQDLLSQGFKKSRYDAWGGTQYMWDKLSGLKEAKILFTNPNTKVNVYYNSRNPKYAGKPVQVAREIPYNKIDKFIDMVVAKYQIKPTELMWTDSTRDKVDAHIVHENTDYLEEK